MFNILQNIFIYFNEKNDAKRWIVNLKIIFLQHKNNKNWIRLINSLLNKKIQFWINNNLDYKTIKTLFNFINVNKQRFIELIQTEYSEQKKVKITQIEIKRFIKALHQKLNEKLKTFYIRTKVILTKINIKNYFYNSTNLFLKNNIILF